ncbi:OPT/YSL family transporter [Cupriavidus basilensis]|uniref:OPT/YSL family transporter n=1 Tax=Cupriavidus basilensis TaxID=68895 RepID=UPI0039F72EDF
MHDAAIPLESAAPPARHPRALAPANLLLMTAISAFGAVVGIQLLTTLGITPNTSLIGALVAMTLARIPLAVLSGFRSVHVQNLAQTSISSATFGAANSLILPIGIPYVMGMPELILPMLAGVSVAMLLDAYLLYRMFDTPAFPASGAWPLGVAAAEAIKAGDSGGKQAWLLAGGLVTGVAGGLLKLPMSAFGVAFIGSFGAMTAFAVGLLLRGYSMPLFGTEIGSHYVPHGMMIGAGLVALAQVARAMFGKATQRAQAASQGAGATVDARADARRMRASFRLGGFGYLAIMASLALATGLHAGMPLPLLLGFILYGAFSAFVHELIVGIAAMHSGWFPAFAVALISLLIGIWIGFPPQALVVLAGFSAATGPAFADMGYDLKAGYILRSEGADAAYEREGRREQLIAAMVGFLVAIVVVLASYRGLFANHQFAPINNAYAAAIKAGISADTARNLLLWALPGMALQLIGGARQQLGVLLATGLLITNPAAGWMVAAGLVVRAAMLRWQGHAAKERLEVFAGGVIAGDALFSFFGGLTKSLPLKK